MRVIDLGCGQKKYNNSIGLDIKKSCNPDVVADVDSNLPFRNNSFNLIYSEFLVEHIHNVFHLIEECWRILKPKGKAIIIAPHFSWHLAYGADHIRTFRINNFSCFTHDTEFSFISDKKFTMKRIQIGFPKQYGFLSKLFNKHKDFWEKTFLRNLFPATSITYEMEVIK